MSGYDYSHPDHVRGRPIISYDVSRGTRSYVTRIESRAATTYKYPTSHSKVDSSMVNHGRPPEVENFITQILNEVNGPPGLATIPNSGPNWGRRSSPVRVYPTRDYGSDYYPSSPPVKSKVSWDHGDPYDHDDRSPGLVYDHRSHRDSGIPNKGYLDQSCTKAKAPRDYEAPKQWDRSPYPAEDPWGHYKSPTKLEIFEDYAAPKTNWGSPSINPHTPEDHEVPNKQWDKSSPSYGDRSPNNQPSKMWRDYKFGNDRWGISGGKPQSSDSYEIPRNSYQPPLDGKPSGAPKASKVPQSAHSYGIHDNQPGRSSSPIRDYSLPNEKNTGGVPNSRWESSLMKPQSPKGYGVPSNQWYRSSSPNDDHSPPLSKKNGGVLGVPSNRWGNSSMNPQSPTSQGFSNHWDRSLSPVRDHPPPTKNTGGLPSVPSSRWGNSLTKPLSPKGHGYPNNQLNRSLSPNRELPPPTKNKEGALDVPSSQWGNSLMRPQYPEVHRFPNNQWDRSFSPNHDHRPPPKNTKGEPGVQSNRWDNSLMKPRSPRDNGVSNHQWDKTSSPDHDRPPPATKNTEGVYSVPRNRWGDSTDPQSPKDHGVPNKQWNRSSSPIHDQPPPNGNNRKVSGAPNNQWDNSLTKPQPQPPQPGNNRKVSSAPNNQWDNSVTKPQPQPQPQPLKDYDVPKNQWGKTSNPVLDHPPPNKNNGGALGIPSNEWGNSVKPQSPKDHGVSNKQWDRSSSPSYDHPSATRKYDSVKPQPFKNHENPRSMSLNHDNQWPNSPVKSQPPTDYGAFNKLDKQPSLARDHSPLSGDVGDPPLKPPQSPKGGFNQWNRSSSSPPTRNTIGVPNNRLANSSLNPQSPRVTSNPNDKQIGNNKGDIQISKTKPDDYVYDRQPKEYGSKVEMKPSAYHSSPPRQTTTPPSKITNNIEPSPHLKIATGRSPDYLTNSQSGNNGYSYPASKEPVRETKSNIY